VKPVTVWQCTGCGRRIFPFRELCPYCSGRSFAPDTVDRGVVAEVTRHRGVRIASIRVDEDIVLLARAAAEVADGSPVELREEGAAPVVEAVVERGLPQGRARYSSSPPRA
jgi:uncharacterized OB-fold protein